MHGNEIFAGRKIWRSVPREERCQFIMACLGVFSGPSRQNLRAFGMVVDKSLVDGDPVHYAYEQLTLRFDRFLGRDHRQNKGKRKPQKHRGLTIFDDSRYEQDLQDLAQEYRVNGTRHGALPHLAEVPLFASSKASRLIQLADLVSFALWRRFEKDDRQFLASFAGAFDRSASRTHGLHHRTNDPTCRCPSCTKT